MKTLPWDTRTKKGFSLEKLSGTLSYSRWIGRTTVRGSNPPAFGKAKYEHSIQQFLVCGFALFHPPSSIVWDGFWTIRERG